MAQGRVVGDRSQAGHGVVDGQVDIQPGVFDHREDKRGSSDLEVGRDLAHVRVADDHMEPAVLLRVRMWLVPGVDDRTLQGCLQADLDLEEIGPLAQLETGLPAVHADADPAGATHDLPGDEEGHEVADDVGERCGAGHEVVLMAAVGDALVVRVVLVQVHRHRARDGQRPPGGLGHDPLPGLVPQHRVARVRHLGGGVLGVGVVDVEARAIGEDDVGEPQVVLVGGSRRIDRGFAGKLEAACVAQR